MGRDRLDSTNPDAPHPTIKARRIRPL